MSRLTHVAQKMLQTRVGWGLRAHVPAHLRPVDNRSVMFPAASEPPRPPVIRLERMCVSRVLAQVPRPGGNPAYVLASALPPAPIIAEAGPLASQSVPAYTSALPTTLRCKTAQRQPLFGVARPALPALSGPTPGRIKCPNCNVSLLQ